MKISGIVLPVVRSILGVGIDQLEFECLRETSTDGRFAGTGRTDEYTFGFIDT